VQQLARTGLLRSSRGTNGGFAFRVPPAEVKLWDIVAVLDGRSQYTACATSLSECSDEMPCSMHDGWVALRTSIIDYLERNTIADLVKPLDQKRTVLAKQRKSKKKP
jgi:Rrf2 family protein